jgi:hypothetical protein
MNGSLRCYGLRPRRRHDESIQLYVFLGNRGIYQKRRIGGGCLLGGVLALFFFFFFRFCFSVPFTLFSWSATLFPAWHNGMVVEELAGGVLHLGGGSPQDRMLGGYERRGCMRGLYEEDMGEYVGIGGTFNGMS